LNSSLWCSSKIENVLERCARSREEFQNKEKKERWPEFTENFAGVRQHLRIGKLECRQPGGGSTRVLGERGVREEGLYRREGETKTEPNQSD
jgi:hypothetical protein